MTRRGESLVAGLRLVIAATCIVALSTEALAAGIVDAARRNQTAQVHAQIDGGADVNERSADGTSALHWAVHYDNAALVARLLEAGADANAINDYGATPLTEAAAIGNIDVVRALLDAGAEVDAPGKDGQTPLMILARSGGVEAARLLLARGAEVDTRETWKSQTALIWAAAQSQPGMVKLLLEHGADPNARSEPPNWLRQVSAEKRRLTRPFGGLTALLYAAREGCIECAKELIEGGADIDLGGYRGITPLMMALDNYHFDLASYLVDAGAMLNIWDWWGRTPLYVAVDMNTLRSGGRADLPSTDETPAIEVVEKILQRGANPNIQLKMLSPLRDRGRDRGCDSMLGTGTTALLRAAKTFDVDSMRLLIAHGARLDLPNSVGVQPIMAAAGYGSIECDIRGYGPRIPYYLTADVQDASIRAIKVLLEAGADINARTTGGTRGRAAGQTPLFGAAFWGWNDVVKYLVENGAEIDATDPQGRTAVDAAMGRAGGHERGSSILVFEETAELLRTLCAAQPACTLP